MYDNVNNKTVTAHLPFPTINQLFLIVFWGDFLTLFFLLALVFLASHAGSTSATVCYYTEHQH